MTDTPYKNTLREKNQQAVLNKHQKWNKGKPCLHTPSQRFANGNRTGLTVGATQSTYSYPATSNRLASISGGTTDNIGYDAADNIQYQFNRKYTHDARGRLSAVNANGFNVSFGVEQHWGQTTVSSLLYPINRCYPLSVLSCASAESGRDIQMWWQDTMHADGLVCGGQIPLDPHHDGGPCEQRRCH